MIPRYWGKELRGLWDGNRAKFANWLRVELAVLQMREFLGQIPPGTHLSIFQSTWIDDVVTQHIERRDRTIGHDLNAFVEIMRCQILLGQDRYRERITLGADDYFDQNIEAVLAMPTTSLNAGYFHDGMTSYDTEEAAMQMLVASSCGIVLADIEQVVNVLTALAEEYREVFVIGRTHGQHAQPITFGVKILNWRDLMIRARDALAVAKKNACVMKLSGAVGIYGTLSPEVESLVGEVLDLRPVISTQILALDYRARVISELAFVSSAVEKIAEDIWLMCQTEVGEIREPFSARQKGSSAMPHKKNPIKFENIRGFAALMRGYAHASQELCCTTHERDISHSGADRLIIPDAFGVMDHQLRTLSKLLEGMNVSVERMRDNLELSYGTWASQRVEMMLKKHGLPAEVAYRAVQDLCFRAVSEKKPLEELLTQSRETDSALKMVLADTTPEEWEWCFQPSQWTISEPYIYERAGL